MSILTLKRIGHAVSGIVFFLTASFVNSGTMGMVAIPPAGSVYFGAFGGWGELNASRVSMAGTVFLPDLIILGGPLAVMASGSTNRNTNWLAGAHIGFSWNRMTTFLALKPALELEGYYLGGVDIKGDDIFNDSTRIQEHTFHLQYPVKTGAFFINAVLSTYKLHFFERLTPYIGVGLGSAILSISNATALQVNPPEGNLNHYNSDPDDRALAFAAQAKIGMSYQLSPGSRFFLEYRFLYLSQTSYTFGSTVAFAHATTSPWLVKIQPQIYNMGTLGFSFDI